MGRTRSGSAPTALAANAVAPPESSLVPQKTSFMTHSSLATRVVTSLALASVVFSLAACSAGSGGQAEPAGCAASGASSDKIKVTGGADETPTVDFPSPLTATATERTVIDEGKGDPAKDGASVNVDILGFNATTGEAVTALTADAQQITLGGSTLQALTEVLKCSSPGARIASVIPPIPNIDQQGAEIGLTASDSVVLVVDVNEVSAPVKVLPRADGEDQPAPAGFPTVELAENGAPTITIPATPPPADLQIAALKIGDGAKVAQGDNVTVHYTGVVYATGEVFDSSWDRGTPVPFTTDGVIPGFGKALVGQTVGSQVIAVIPPSEGYGANVPEGASFGPTDTLVFVADILAVQ